jgi:hypothetical protein
MRLRLLLISTLTVAAVAACGGEEETQPMRPTTSAPTATEESSGDLAAAAESTSETGSSRVAFEATIDEQSFSGEGAFDYDEGVGSMTLELGGTATELFFQDDAVYTELPLGALPLGKRWIRIDLERLGEVSGLDLPQLAQAGQATPGLYLRFLRAAEDVELVGKEDVRGVETTHYRALLDLEQLAEEEPGLRESVRALGSELVLDAVPTEVWIDDDGLVRRISQEYESGTSRTKVTMELYDFGLEVDAEAPPEELVLNLGDLIGGGFD